LLTDISDEILTMVLKKLTLLEDLGISARRYTIPEDLLFSSPYSLTAGIICSDLSVKPVPTWRNSE
jgi:hypothetical protein